MNGDSGVCEFVIRFPVEKERIIPKPYHSRTSLSLRAGREAVARGVTPLGKDAPIPARRALRSTASRPAEHVNINWKGY
ncbi:MAG: hypothetical protein OXE42_08960 [Gammaproteobacteria bacterium]|nr:hypothetical protein [Gammaproteobacteria bacterium]